MVNVEKEYEVGFEFPREISNEIEVQDGDRVVIYRGTAFGLFLEGLTDVRGGARVEKFEKTTVALPPKKSWLFWPFKYVPVPRPPKEKLRLMWSFVAELGNPYFMSNGETKTELASCYYRGHLVAEAANNQVALTQKLLDELFGPIDRKIAELRAQVEKMTGV